MPKRQTQFNVAATEQKLIAAFDDEDKFTALLIHSKIDSDAMNYVFRRALEQNATNAATVMLNTVSDRIDLEATMVDAAARGHADICELLLKRGGKPVACNGNDTPLHFAVIFNNPKLAQLLIDHGADVHAKNWKGETPIMLAPVGQAWTVGIIRTMLNAGANPQDGNNILLREAASHSDLPLIKLLQERGADLKCCDHRGQDLLEIARRGHELRFRLGRAVDSDAFKETLMFLKGEAYKPQPRKPPALRR
jgi:hypothetical protein